MRCGEWASLSSWSTHEVLMCLHPKHWDSSSHSPMDSFQVTEWKEKPNKWNYNKISDQEGTPLNTLEFVAPCEDITKGISGCEQGKESKSPSLIYLARSAHHAIYTITLAILEGIQVCGRMNASLDSTYNLKIYIFILLSYNSSWPQLPFPPPTSLIPRSTPVNLPQEKNRPPRDTNQI